METFKTRLEPNTALKFDRLPATLALVGLGKTQLYALVAKGEFPAPIRIGARACAWERGEVQAWMRSRLQARKGECK